MDKKNLHECPMQTAINRREFLKDVGKGAVAAMTVPALFPFAGCDIETLERVPLSKPESPPSGTVTVGIARRNNIKAAVQKAIELGGGLSEIKSGDTVLIKPNIVGVGFGVRPYTHPVIIEAVIQEIKKYTGVENITVAEGSYSGPGSRGTLQNAQFTGILDVAIAEGVAFIPWEDETITKYVEIISNDIKHLGYNIQIPKTLVDGTYDHFINMPIIKNHTWRNAGYTCCLKNFVGTMRLSNRNGRPLQSDHDWIDLARGVAELGLSTPEITMNILDGLSVVLTGGPMHPSDMTTADANLILASKDRVAADSLALAVMRHYASLDTTIDEPYQKMSVWEQPQITRALELNLGRGAENIDIASDGVDEIDDIIAQWT